MHYIAEILIRYTICNKTEHKWETKTVHAHKQLEIFNKSSKKKKKLKLEVIQKYWEKITKQKCLIVTYTSNTSHFTLKPHNNTKR